MSDWFSHLTGNGFATTPNGHACWRRWLPYLIGYGFATVVAHFPIAWLVDRLWISIGGQPKCWKEERPDEWWLPIIVGLVERALYVGFLCLGAPAFVGVWLVLKVANKWYAWKDDLKEGGRTLKGSSIFNIFVIGNGLSIGYAMVGFHLISEVGENVDAWRRVVCSSIGALAILVTTVCLWLIAKCHQEKPKRGAAGDLLATIPVAVNDVSRGAVKVVYHVTSRK